MGDQRPPSVSDYCRLTEQEIVFGRMVGLTDAEPIPSTAAPPRAALEAVVGAALRQPPCYVSFSGGRDSSAILAVATAVARRDGLPDPIPMTEVYPLAPESHEAHWQRMVIGHLALRDWLRIEFGTENDLVGPTAQGGLRRLGLLWPPTLQIKPNVFTRVTGGTLLTGEGGDEALEGGRITPIARLARRVVRPNRATLRAAGKALAPAWLRRRHGLSLAAAAEMLPWLRRGALTEFLRLSNAESAAEPLRWAQSLWWLRRLRVSVEGQRNYTRLAAENGVRLVHPFAEPVFLASLARAGGVLGYSSRTEMMRMLFSDVLPAAVIERTTKATFNRAYFSDATRAFAREWDGSGLDEAAIDTAVLRAEWLSDRPSALSGVALQAAWLAQHGQRAGGRP